MSTPAQRLSGAQMHECTACRDCSEKEFHQSLTFKEGDSIQLLGRTPATTDGYWVAKFRNKTGVVHEKDINIFMKATSKYDKKEPDELSIVKYEVLQLITSDTRTPGWWKVKRETGEDGLLPCNYMEIETLTESFGVELFSPARPGRKQLNTKEYMEANSASLLTAISANGPVIEEEVVAPAQNCFVAFCKNGNADGGPINTFVMTAIVGCAIQAGLETYPTVVIDYAEPLGIFDKTTLVIFIFEILSKMIGDLPRPWLYFVGPEWKWNWFDFFIVSFCILDAIASAQEGGGFAWMRSLRLLRMVRLVRVLKILRKIPEIRMILMGIVEGVKGAFWIMLLLMLIYYIFAVMAMMLFSKNDPWHFPDLANGLLTLFRCTTCEDWTDVMYIGMFGCMNYGYDLESDYGIYGCDPEQSVAQPLVASLYHVVMIMVTALIMLSLFVGVICAGMDNAVAQMKAEAEQEILDRAGGDSSTERSTGIDMSSLPVTIDELKDMINKVWVAGAMGEEAQILPWHLLWDRKAVKDDQVSSGGKWYLESVAIPTYFLVEGALVSNFVMLVIVICGVMAGCSASDAEFDALPIVEVLEKVILFIFTAELLMKIVGCGLNPLRIFMSSWNCFDFFVVVACYLPGTGSFAGVLRLARLMRLLRLLKSIPQLTVIVEGLVAGFSSISYIAVLVAFCFYLFSIVGVQLFRENDPWHFTNLHVGMLTLFRCSTMEDWTDVMYINMFGCDKYGYDHDTLIGACVNPSAHPLAASFYFVAFEMFSALVLFTLFIGVVCTGIDQSMGKMDGIMELQKETGISHNRMQSFKDIFALCDVDGSEAVDVHELTMVLDALRIRPGMEQTRMALAVCDANSNGVLEFAEFTLFLYILAIPSKDQNNPVYQFLAGHMQGSPNQIAYSAPMPKSERKDKGAEPREQRKADREKDTEYQEWLEFKQWKDDKNGTTTTKSNGGNQTKARPSAGPTGMKDKVVGRKGK